MTSGTKGIDKLRHDIIVLEKSSPPNSIGGRRAEVGQMIHINSPNGSMVVQGPISVAILYYDEDIGWHYESPRPGQSEQESRAAQSGVYRMGRWEMRESGT